MVLDITASVKVYNNYKTVFDYISNYNNDSFWRREVKLTTVNSLQTGIGTVVTQYSFLSKQMPYHKNTFTCTGFVANKIIVYETKGDEKFWQRNTRIAAPLSENSTQIIYQVEFDTAIVKHSLGFGLPNFILRLYTKQTMKQYLTVLKNLLENEMQYGGFNTHPYYAGD